MVFLLVFNLGLIMDNKQTINVAISGMTCQACASRIEKVLNKKSSIKMASVNFAGESANITFDDSKTTIDEIIGWIKKAGFDAVLMQDSVSAAQVSTIPYSLLGLWALSLPFWVGMFGMLFGSHAFMPPIWLQFVLATLVQFGFGGHFYKGAWASIKGGLANMDVLVALATTVIWAYSTYVWLQHGEHVHYQTANVYFEASVMVMAFVSLGKYLENRTKKNSLNSLSTLLALVPDDVLIKKDDHWQKIAVTLVKPDDILLARTGDRIAVDGIVVNGLGYADEAHLTGESMVLVKKAGDKLLAGSLISEGSLEYQAVATGQNSVLGDVAKALSDAQNTKAKIARVADKVASVFVPVVVSVSLLTLLVNLYFGIDMENALMRAVAVLVIACPCALGIATPAAIMVGMGLGVKHGVVFKDAISLETAGSIDTMVFDKTGTLTTGKPSLQAYKILDETWDFDKILSISASLETHANHPLAQSIVQAAHDKNLPLYPVENVSSQIGQGLVGEIKNIGTVKIGTLDFVGLNQNSLPKDDIYQKASIVGLLINQQAIAIFALLDTIKLDTHIVVNQLKKENIDVVMMSGDKKTVVDWVSQELSLSQAFAQMLPNDKASKIKQMQDKGKKIAMIGDGINDAPAMAQADASFAVGQASDVAKQTASVQLMGDALVHAYYAQKISKLTLRNIKQNLFFAFIYNILGISFAAIGLLNPMIAASAMAMSSISVMLNALRLKRLDLTNYPSNGTSLNNTTV